jgi:hypothetical protein
MPPQVADTDTEWKEPIRFPKKWHKIKFLLAKQMWLEAVNLNPILLHETLLRQKVEDIFSLITLQLNDLAKLWIINNCAVAAEI